MGREIRYITQPEFNEDFPGENMKDTDREVEKRVTLAGFAALGGGGKMYRTRPGRKLSQIKYLWNEIMNE